jgi:hypothetical protein
LVHLIHHNRGGGGNRVLVAISAEEGAISATAARASFWACRARLLAMLPGA